MEAATGVAAGRGGSLSVPSSSSSSSSTQSARKEWRAVPEHSVRNTASEELERSKLGQSDERTIYEQGPGSLNVDFCSITMDGSLDSDPLRQRLHSVSRQREELQQMEIDLRVQVTARSEIIEMQTSFDTQIKEHADIAAKLKVKLMEREQTIHELEFKMEEKDRELRATKIDNEAAWANEDLLREQNKELATFRRERDNSEAERAQHLKQMHELKEHIQQKERQFLELEEQHRVAQETILYKDEQLREAHAWVARVQEMDHSIHSELRERTEHFNQFWIGCQRQFADMVRQYLQTIQQLQLDLAEARERSGTYTDESHMAHTDSKDASSFGHNNRNQYNVNEGSKSNANSEVLPNGNVDGVPPYVSTGNALTEVGLRAEHAPGVPVVPSSLLGMGAYLPPGQVTALHSFVMHQQGVPHSVPSPNSHVPQAHVEHFQPIPAISFNQHWQNQQVVSESLQILNQSQYLPSQTEQNLLSSGSQYDYDVSKNGQVIRSDYLESHISVGGPVITTSSVEEQNLEANDKCYLVTQKLLPNLEGSSSEFHDALGLDSDQNSETKGGENTVNVTNPLQEKGLTVKQPSHSETPTHQVNSSETTNNNASGVIFPELSVSTGWTSHTMTPGKIPEPTLLDERSLLACIVRAIPAGSGGRIRISSTLPNRLGKMLAPLHWHDYKKIYGKLDDFLSGHPELFVIEGDFIQLREGAQEIISATAAVAKVAAAAAAPTTYSSFLPSIAVTPMAQNHHLKKIPSVDSKSLKIGAKEPTGVNSADSGDKPTQPPAMQNQHSNGVCYNIVRGLSNIKILSKPEIPLELNALQSEIRSGHSSVHIAVGNGANPDRTGLSTYQNKGSSDGRHDTNFGAKQQGRAAGAILPSRR